MIYPSRHDWLFSLKTFAAAMIALYVALEFSLPRPYWALATVYLVSNPFVGATRSKAIYRAIGTAIGAAGSILIVPPFVESPYLFSAIVALWTGTLIYLALNDRTARSYVLLLAGYTLPLIALPAVIEPTTIFDLAITRTEEIVLGIVCASIVGTTIFPNRLAPTLIERTDSWFRDAAFFTTEILSGRIASAAVSACRQRLAANVNGLDFLLSQLAYDHAPPRILARSYALSDRMQLLLPVASSFADPLVVLFGGDRPRSAELVALIADVVKWFNTSLASADDREQFEQGADRLRERIAQLQPPAEALSIWATALEANVLFRLRQLVDVWQDCLTLRVTIAHDGGSWRPRYRHWRFGGSERYFDRGIMLFSAGTVALSIIVACALWISSGWQDGASAVALGALASSFFAALDEPAPQLFKFFLTACLSLVVAGFAVFAVLPNVTDFPSLVLVLAAPFLLIGTQITSPKFSLVATLTALNTANFIGLQSAFNADFLVFLNSNLAGIAGLLFAFMWTRVTRPFGAEYAASRLLRASWEDVVLSASTRPIEDQRNLSARMLDRLMQLIPRLGATDDHHHPSIDSFRDLRIAFSALDLRRLRPRFKDDVQDVIDHVLDGVRHHFESCLEQRARRPVQESLMRSLDAAIERVTSQHLADIEAGAATSERQLRNALHALVGLRLSLFPAAIAPATPVAE